MIREAIDKAVNGIDLTEEEARGVMSQVMGGTASPAQIAAFITALRMKGETVPEVTGCARAMRTAVTKVNTKHILLVDTCGTGGDMSNTFNISTVGALAAAGAGVVIAKHGNRSVSSRCGSADLLEKLAVNINASLQAVERCINEAGICFLYAPLLHPAMKYAIGPRREIGIRTVFNILGPLTNPAGAKAQVLGVYSPSLTRTMAEVLGRLGAEDAWVVHGDGGLDEISVTGPTQVCRWQAGHIKEFTVFPEEYGIALCRKSDIRGGDADTNADIALGILKGEKGPKRDAVVLNAAAAIVCGKKAEDIREGIKLAEESIDSGKALEKLEDIVRITKENAS